MKLFRCDNCGNSIYFESRSCLKCGFRLGFVCDEIGLHAMQPDPNHADRWRRVDQQFVYRFCPNAAFDVCNWLVCDDSDETFCAACRYNGLVSNPKNKDDLRLHDPRPVKQHRSEINDPDGWLTTITLVRPFA